MASSEFISESEQAKFTIISQLTNASPLNVDIILDQGVNDFIDGSLERTVTFQPSSVGTQLVVDLVDDQIDENSGKITATVMPGASYLVSPINNSAVIYVNDNDDPPVMSISTSQTSITEGESAEFQLSAEGQWSEEILVQLNIIDTGNFVNTNSRLVTFAPNSEDTGEVINVSIPTIQDGLIEQDGTLTVSILPNNAFNKRKLYSIATSNSNAQVQVRDDDGPMLSITAVNSKVSESERAEFKIVADVAPLTDIEINLAISQTRTVIDQPIENFTSVTLHQGRTNATLAIPLINNDVFQKNAFIHAKLETGTNYQFSESESSAEVYVEDNDPLNEVTIQSIAENIVEGEDAEFLIVTQATNVDRTIELTINKIGEYFTDAEISSVLLEANESIAEISIPTIDDEQNEADGSIEIVLNDGANYSIAQNDASAIIAIEDNDSQVEISLTSIATAVDEGETAQFLLSTSRISQTDTEITLQLTAPQGYLSNNNNIASATIVAGQLSTMLEIPIVEDNNGESDGLLEVELQSSSDYTIHPVHNSAQTIILDNDFPRISVHSTRPVYEGGETTFVVASSLPVPAGLKLNVNLEIEGDYTSDISGDFQIDFYSNEVLGTPVKQYHLFNVGHNNNVQEDGSFTLTMKPGTGYNLAIESQHQITNTIWDRESYTVTVGALEDSVIEGAVAQFMVSAGKRTSTPVPINMEITQIGDFISNETPNQLIVPVDSFGDILRIQTKNDSMFEQTGEIKVQIIEGDGYRPHYQYASATITIKDNDGPELSIAANSDSISEDSNAIFTISSTKSISSDLSIPLLISASGDFLTATEFEPAILLAGTTTAEYQVAIDDDTSFELDGSISRQKFNIMNITQ